ncbi:hypothetical protein C3L33_05710, partial [Rhododendron williamsianum]
MNLTQLENLKLTQVNISSGLPDSLLNLSSLATIDLSETRLNGKLPDSIGYLGFLNYLDLSSNELFGPLPESLGNLTRITQLRLSGNGLNGQVPSTLSNLEQLTEFRVGYNNLDGTIPEFFSKLIKLEYLSLRSNNFSGPFPRWVANLTQLREPVSVEVKEDIEDGDKIELPPTVVPFSRLFACASRLDWALMVVRSLSATAHGTALLVYLHYFAKIIHFLVHDNPDTRDVLLNDFYDVMFFKPCAFRFLNLEIIGFVMH